MWGMIPMKLFKLENMSSTDYAGCFDYVENSVAVQPRKKDAESRQRVKTEKSQ